MNFPLFVARKYFFSKKKKNFINVISMISMLVVGIGTMALIIVLSVFNGLEDLIRSIYGTFDPQIVITSAEGKSFELTRETISQIEKTEGVEIVTEVIEDNVLIKYNNAQRVVRLKGVSENFLAQNRLDKSIVLGEMKLTEGNVNYAIIGRGVQFDLSVNPNNDFFSLQVFYPKNIRPGNTNPSSMYTIKHILPSSVFAIEKFYDDNYVFVPLAFSQSLLNYGNKRTALELSLSPEVDARRVKDELQSHFDGKFIVRVGDELHADIYKIMKWEKLMVFLTFSLIIAIASINIYFVLTMLAIDKQKDIAILSAQGATGSLITKIFIVEGMIIALTGAGLGLIMGLSISLLQKEYGFVTMGMQSAIMNAYPVKIEFWDIVMTACAMIFITILASFQPARLAVKNLDFTKL